MIHYIPVSRPPGSDVDVVCLLQNVVLNCTHRLARTQKQNVWEHMLISQPGGRATEYRLAV